MAALVGGHRGSRHDGARRDPLPLPLRMAHLLVLAAGESPTMEWRRKAYGELPCRGAMARGWRLPWLAQPAPLLSLPPVNGRVVVELISSPLHVPSSVPPVGGEVRVRQLGPHVGTFHRETTLVLPAEPKGGRTKAGDVALTGFFRERYRNGYKCRVARSTTFQFFLHCICTLSPVFSVMVLKQN
jgi:hypothetical protein